MACLGDVRYLGPGVGSASALDLAWLCDAYGRFIALAHSACICESEGVGVDVFADLFVPESLVSRYARIVHAGDYSQRTATLDVWAAALERIRTQGRDAGISTEFPDFAAALFARARAAGYGDDNVMSIFRVLRGRQGDA